MIVCVQQDISVCVCLCQVGCCWTDVRVLLVDDFLRCGTDQILLVFEEPRSSGELLSNFLLTDLCGITYSVRQLTSDAYLLSDVWCNVIRSDMYEPLRLSNIRIMWRRLNRKRLQMSSNKSFRKCYLFIADIMQLVLFCIMSLWSDIEFSFSDLFVLILCTLV